MSPIAGPIVLTLEGEAPLDAAGGSRVPTVLIVGSRLLQEGLAVLLQRDRRATSIGECRPREAVAMAEARLPDVIIIELPARGGPALSYVPALTRIVPRPRLIVMARDIARGPLVAALELGVDACISEEGGAEELVTALEAVCRAEHYVAPVVRTALALGLDGSGSVPIALAANADPRSWLAVLREEERTIGARLSPREREVLELIVAAKTDREMAAHLGLSPKTVHTHRMTIMRKLDVHNVIMLVRRAILLGLVPP